MTAFRETLRNNVRQYTMIAALLIIWMIFSVLTNGLFITPRNLSNLLLQMVTIGIMTSGMLLVMVAGHIDLSIGSVCGTLGALVAYLMIKMEVPPVFAIMITMGVSFLVGSWHGYWVAYRGVPAFIATLSSQIAFKGFTLFITNGKTIGEFPVFFKSIGQGFIPRLVFTDPETVPFHDLTVAIFLISIALFVIMDLRKRKNRIAKGFDVLPFSLEIFKIVAVTAGISVIGYVLGSYRGMPYAILILSIVVIIFSIVTTRTPFGRHVYAIGGNSEAAKLSGVNNKKTLLKIFMLMGTLCGVASIVFTARLNAATTAAGTLFELDTIAACIIGGTSTTGGIGTVFGAIIGALVMASLDNGMSLMNVEIMYQYIIKGMILLLAVWIDLATKKK